MIFRLRLNIPRLASGRARGTSIQLIQVRPKESPEHERPERGANQSESSRKEAADIEAGHAHDVQGRRPCPECRDGKSARHHAPFPAHDATSRLSDSGWPAAPSPLASSFPEILHSSRPLPPLERGIS